MDSWIWQGGYPLVRAALAPDGRSVTLSQRRFLFAGDDDGTRWAVPIHVRQRAGGREDEQKLLLDGDEVTVALLAPDALVVVNAGANGFFRVEYDAALLGRLAGPALATLSTAERYSLVDDAWASVVAGRLSGTAPDGWLPVADLSVGSPAQRGLPIVNFVRECDAAALPGLRAGPRGARPRTPRLAAGPGRGRPHRRAAGHADPRSRQPGQRSRRRATGPLLHARALVDPSSVPPAVAAAALSVVSANGGEAEYEAGLARYRASHHPQDQRRELMALSEFRDASLFDRTLALALTDDVRTQDAPMLLGRCIAHRDHGVRAWRFVRERWDELNARFPSNLMVRVVEPVPRLTRPQEQADVAAFLAEHPLPQAAKRVEQALERQGVNVLLREREEPALAPFQ